MENKSVRSIANWFRNFFSYKKERIKEEGSLEETLSKALKRQKETQHLIDQTTEQSAQTGKDISDFTNKMLNNNWEMIDKINKNNKKL